jgi:hypothetical protein
MVLRNVSGIGRRRLRLGRPSIVARSAFVYSRSLGEAKAMKFGVSQFQSPLATCS